MTAGVAMSLPVLAAALVGCIRTPDPCGDATTCVQLDVDSFLIRTIDQLELDLVYGNVHSTTTIGTKGTSIELPVSTALLLDLPGPLIDISFVAAARLEGKVLGADAQSVSVQSGHQTTAFLHLEPYDGCVEGALYCGGIGGISADYSTLYQCDHDVPLYYGRCLGYCSSIGNPGGVCVGSGGLCRDAGTYCGGHKVDGDPFTLYVCQDFRGAQPRTCPNGCLVRNDGDDVCQ